MAKEPSLNGIPSQAVPYTEKTSKWVKRTVDAFESLCNFESTGVRVSRYRKHINFNLWDGYLDKNDMFALMNPDSMEDSTIDTDIQHYPIITGQFNVLIGEEIQRKFTPTIIVTNPDAVSEKEAGARDYMRSKIQAILQDENLTDDQKADKMKRLKKFMTYEYQDAREVRANRIVKYLIHELRLHKKWNDGFKNALLSAEEIYEIGSFGGSLEFNVLNTKNVFTIMSGSSNQIEDADVIIIENYRSPGQLVDRYYDDLTAADVKSLESISMVTWSGEKDFIDPKRQVSFFAANMADNQVNDLVDLTQFVYGGMAFGSPTDVAGNIRELRFLWKSKKKMLKVTYPNPNTGENEVKWMPETYVPNEIMGEKAVVKYVNEWWECTRLGSDLDIRMRPVPVQYFRLSNPSKVSPGIIGTVYNTNGGRGISLMDRVKPYQYLYNVIYHQAKEAMRTYMGPIMEVDMAKIPTDWKFEKWLFYAKKMKIAVVDSFAEGKRGQALGKLAGNFNTTGQMYNPNMGNYIQQLITMMEYIELQVRIQTGVTRQREGQNQSRETAQGIQEALGQSTAMTEPLFMEHEETQIRTVRYLIEAAKHHYKGQKFVAQNFLDDGSLELFEMDGDEFADADYDVVAVDGRTVAKIRQQIEALAHAGIQNETVTFSTLLDIYMSPSIQDMRKSIESAENEKRERDQKNFETQEETKRQAITSAQEMKKEENELTWKQAVLKSDTEIEKALILAEGYGFEDNDDEIEALESKRNTLLDQMREMDKQMIVQKEKKRQIEIESEQAKTRKKRATPAASK